MTELVYYDTSGTAYVLPCLSVVLHSYRVGRPTVLKAQVAKEGDALQNGFRIALRQDGKTEFLGYLFTRKVRRDYTELTAYDSLRYLLYRDSQAFYGKTAAEIVRAVAVRQNLTLGEVEQTDFRIPELLCDNKPLLDMVLIAVEKTGQATGEYMVFYDAVGKLNLKSEQNLRLPHVLTAEQSLFDLQCGYDLDEDSYNRVLLYSVSARSGRRRFEVEDRESIQRWGVLSHCEEIAVGLNDGQAMQLAKSLLVQKNREKKSICLTAPCDLACRAGFSLRVQLDGGEEFYRIEQAEHRLEQGRQEMTLWLCSGKN